MNLIVYYMRGISHISDSHVYLFVTLILWACCTLEVHHSLSYNIEVLAKLSVPFLVLAMEETLVDVVKHIGNFHLLVKMYISKKG